MRFGKSIKKHTQIIRLALKNKERNISLVQENRIQYYGFLNVNLILNNKDFWRVFQSDLSTQLDTTNKVKYKIDEREMRDDDSILTKMMVH